MELEQMFITNPTNHGNPNTNHPTYIVIHDTGNVNKTAGAYNHYLYIQNHRDTGKSAHIYVDSKQAIQTIPFTTPAWHTGKWYVTKPEFPMCTNFNSIGIEFCINADGDLMQTIQNTLLITIKVMKANNIPYNRVITHQQSSGKSCPNTFITNPSLKKMFFKQLLEMAIAKDVVLQKALEILEKHQVTNSTDYWYKKSEEIEHLRNLIVNMANALGGN